MKKRLNLILVSTLLLGLIISCFGTLSLVQAKHGNLTNKQKRKASSMINEYRDLAMETHPDEVGRGARIYSATEEFRKEIVDEMLNLNKTKASKFIILGAFLILGVILLKIILHPNPS